MVAQSFHQSGPLVLNGSLTRLGQAMDLIREGCNSSSLMIEFENNYNNEHNTQPKETISATVTLETSESSNSTLEIQALEIASSLDKDHNLKLSRSGAAKACIETIKAHQGHPDVTILHLKKALGDNKKHYKTYLAILGMQPIALYQFRSPQETEALVKKFLGNAARIGKRLKPENEIKRTESVFKLGINLYELIYHKLRYEEHSPEVEKVLQKLSASYGHNMLVELSQLPAREMQVLTDALVADSNKREYATISIDRGIGHMLIGSRSDRPTIADLALDDSLDITIDVLKKLRRQLTEVARNVNYLGPLRDEPRVYWAQWSGNRSNLPVGIKGEYSADILSREPDHKTRFFSPDGEEISGTLDQAIDTWLSYLEVGENVTTENSGKLGFGLSISMNGSLRDLTSVGVGVSQVLPLLVAFFRIPPESSLLIEQPELHLHPKVQARIADFFMFARDDISVFVETHSEAIVTRIRRRVAEGQKSADSVRIIFVEPSADGAKSRLLEVSSYGDLSNWPTGFFDDDEDVRAILSANAKRARAMRATRGGQSINNG